MVSEKGHRMVIKLNSLASSRSILRSLWLLLACWLLLSALGDNRVFAVGDASTRFCLFVPANNELLDRDVLLSVIALSDSTIIEIIDDGADGDTDDSYKNLLLNRGQSLVHFIKDGLVNDDAGGKWDGDYFRINANKPIIVLQATASEWQHDWVPADNKKMRGRRFYLYIPPVILAMRDLDVVAYEDNTELVLQKISTVPQLTSGITQVDLKNPQTVLTETLNRGQDLLHIKGRGKQLLEPGATYLLSASKDVTVQMGALIQNMRDGGGYVPSENGTVAGALFYFFLPGEPNKKELRIVSFQDNNTIRLYGYNQSWRLVNEWTLNSYQHADWINYNVGYDYYQLSCTASASVFESNWLETTDRANTADIATFVATEYGNGAGQKFVIYIPPPGIETNIAGQRGLFSHLYFFAHRDNTVIRAFDTQTNGLQFQQQISLNADQYFDLKIDPSLYTKIRNAGQTLGTTFHPYITVLADKNITVLNTNYNDNWMTYAASVLIPTPTVRMTSSKMQISDADRFTITVNGSNEEEKSLEDASLTLELPSGLVIEKITAPAELGAYQWTNNKLIWHGFQLPSKIQYQVSIDLQLPSGASPVLLDGLLEFQAQLSGSSQGDRYASQDGLGIKYIAPPEALAVPVLNSALRAPGDTCVDLVWQYTAVTALKGFILHRSSGSGASALDTIAAGLRAFRDCPVLKNTSYTYELLAFTATQQSEYSNRIAVPAVQTPPDTTLSREVEFFPFPNPMDREHPGPLYFHYRFPEAATCEIMLVDVSGDKRKNIQEQLLAAGEGEIMMDVQSLAADVYFYIARIQLQQSGQTIKKIGKIAILHTEASR